MIPEEEEEKRRRSQRIIKSKIFGSRESILFSKELIFRVLDVSVLFLNLRTMKMFLGGKTRRAFGVVVRRRGVGWHEIWRIWIAGGLGGVTLFGDMR